MSFHGDHHRASSGQGRRRGPNDGASQPFDAQAFGAHPFSMMMGGGGLGGGSSIFDDFDMNNVRNIAQPQPSLRSLR